MNRLNIEYLNEQGELIKGFIEFEDHQKMKEFKDNIKAPAWDVMQESVAAAMRLNNLIAKHQMKELLKKYMELVIDVEGWSFIENIGSHRPKVEFNEEEVEILKLIEKEIYDRN